MQAIACSQLPRGGYMQRGVHGWRDVPARGHGWHGASMQVC